LEALWRDDLQVGKPTLTAARQPLKGRGRALGRCCYRAAARLRPQRRPLASVI